MDKRMFASGVAMVVVGLVISWYLTENIPTGEPGMKGKEKDMLLEAQQKNEDMRSLSNIVAGFGFLLVLISFGLKRGRKGGEEGGGKTVKKPPEQT